MTHAAESLLLRVYGEKPARITNQQTGIAIEVRKHAFALDHNEQSRSQNFGIPRPCYGLAEDDRKERHEWHGN